MGLPDAAEETVTEPATGSLVDAVPNSNLSGPQQMPLRSAPNGDAPDAATAGTGGPGNLEAPSNKRDGTQGAGAKPSRKRKWSDEAGAPVKGTKRSSSDEGPGTIPELEKLGKNPKDVKAVRPAVVPWGPEEVQATGLPTSSGLMVGGLGMDANQHVGPHPAALTSACACSYCASACMGFYGMSLHACLHPAVHCTQLDCCCRSNSLRTSMHACCSAFPATDQHAPLTRVPQDNTCDPHAQPPPKQVMDDLTARYYPARIIKLDPCLGVKMQFEGHEKEGSFWLKGQALKDRVLPPIAAAPHAWRRFLDGFVPIGLGPRGTSSGSTPREQERGGPAAGAAAVGGAPQAAVAAAEDQAALAGGHGDGMLDPLVRVIGLLFTPGGSRTAGTELHDSDA